ncbi:MAG: DinB family protein [Cytophagales bacterium]|nr:DinB family protein [Armatimonadota bacterium]
MDPKLQRYLDAIEQQRTALQSTVLALSDAQLDWTPPAATDAWSIRQIAEHLVLSDESVGCARDPQTIEPEAPMFRILPRAWRRALILWALRRGTVLPLPSPDLAPRGTVPLPDLLSRWEAARGQMRRFLETLPPRRASPLCYAHPVTGPLTPVQMLELGETHTAYHTRQIETLRRDPAFPRGNRK